MHLSRLAAVVTIASQLARAQGSDSFSSAGQSHFAKCFCYRASTGFCHGSDFYNSQACQDWFLGDYGWLISVLVLAVMTIVFPCIFFCSRFCCQCCGGRHPSHGCCCSASETRESFPGYKNGSIIATRAAFVLTFVLLVTASGLTMHHNHNLHNDVNLLLVNNVQQPLQSFITLAQSVNPLTQYLATPPQAYALPSIANWPTVDVQTIQSAMDGVNSASNVENNPGYGRSHVTLVLSAWALVVPFVAIIPMACSWKSSMNVFLVMHTFVAFVILLALAPSVIITEVIGETCDNWYSTVSPLIANALSNAGVSQPETFVNNLQTSLTSVFQNVTPQQDSSSSGGFGTSSSAAGTALEFNFCGDFAAACLSIGGCAVTLCSAPTTNPTWSCNGALNQIDPFYAPSATSVAALLTTPCGTRTETILSLSQTSSDAGSAALRVVNFINAIAPFVNLPPQGYSESQYIENIQYALCTYNLHYRAKSVAIGLGFQYIISLVMIAVLFLGIKRFTHLNSHRQHLSEYQGLRETIVVAAVLDEPYTGDASWSPPPTGYPTTPVAGYGAIYEVETIQC